ncbi:MAG: NAD(P)H-hydrate dehydratase [Rhizobiaceae bacterium]
MARAILTPDEMSRADRIATGGDTDASYGLMVSAGRAVAAEALRRYPTAAVVQVLCGPGNNGGDGYVAASVLAEAGVPVEIFVLASPKSGTDAARAAADCAMPVRPLADFGPIPGALVIDALFGAGLARALDGAAADAARACRDIDATCLAVDLPSGLSGLTGLPLGEAFKVSTTVTFAAAKPGHLLQPGRALCGDLVIADIGMTWRTLDAVGSRCFENGPELWAGAFPRPPFDTHKYRRGHVGVFSGGVASTGAARLSAMAAARSGAGAVTMLSSAAALAVNAAHLTSVILRRADSMEDVAAFLNERKPAALVYGPGLEPLDKTARFLTDLLGAVSYRPATVVVDASALTALAEAPEAFFAALRRQGAPDVVLTPHEGEFARLFPDLTVQSSKLERARFAAARAQAVMVLKGPDTVIATPDGRAAINTNGSPLLATAGSGDVLSGVIAGLAAQGMSPFEAACAAVWLHAEAAAAFGAGLIAEDLPGMLPGVLRRLEPILGGVER